MNRETAEPTVDRSAEAAAAWVAAHRDVAAPSEHSHEFVWNVTGDAAGPFVTDLDGNVLVAFTCHIGAAPLGYNDPKILDKLREDRMSNFKSGSGNLDFEGATTMMEKMRLPPKQRGLQARRKRQNRHRQNNLSHPRQPEEPRKSQQLALQTQSRNIRILSGETTSASNAVF